MDFRLALHIEPWKKQIDLSESLFLIGSCFTEHISGRLASFRFQVAENPNGILFNPKSIAIALQKIAGNRDYDAHDVFEYNGLWQSWDHHGRFAAIKPSEALQHMNEERMQARLFLKKAHWVLVTLGTSFIYELQSGPGFEEDRKFRPVANCHKVPAQHFRHRLMEEAEVGEAIGSIISAIRGIKQDANIIFTISPVRHRREGLIENNRSKGRLHSALVNVLDNQAGIYYFPAYELVIDDLRDYRFFAEDLVHPNYFATQYVWEKFAAACINPQSLKFMERIEKVNQAMKHKPRQPESSMHVAFLQKMKAEAALLAQELPFLDFNDALTYFSQQS